MESRKECLWHKLPLHLSVDCTILSRHKLFPNIKYCVQTTQQMNQTDFKKCYYLQKCGIQQTQSRESSSQKGINSSVPVVQVHITRPNNA
jgi:hypothetical protein